MVTMVLYLYQVLLGGMGVLWAGGSLGWDIGFPSEYYIRLGEGQMSVSPVHITFSVVLFLSTKAK